jgi:HEAT repeat protein
MQHLQPVQAQSNTLTRRMRKQWFIASLVVTAITLGAWLVVLLWPREPVFGGKPLSDWLAQLAPVARSGPYSWLVDRNEDERLSAEQIRQAQIAIHAMGTKAVRFLLHKIRRERSFGERLYGAVWQKIPLGLRQRLAPPKQFQNYGNPHSQIVWALQTLDPDAVPALITAIKDYDSDVQVTALAALGGFGANADVAIPSLIRLAKHPNGFVRRWSIFTLGRLGPKRTNAIPTLITALKDTEISPLPGSPARVRETAAQVLGEIGPQAQAASPELKKLLTDSYPGVRQEVAIALWRIARDYEVLPVLIADLRKAEDQKRIIAVLGEMGPMAKSAMPAIKDAVGPFLSITEAARLSRQRLKRFNGGVGIAIISGDQPTRATLEEVASQALQKIDPENTDDAPETSFVKVSPLSLGGASTGYLFMGSGNMRDTVAALGPNAASAAPALVQLLDDHNPEVRMEGMLALGQIGWKPSLESVPTLTRLLSDRSVFKYRGWQDKDLGLELVCIGDLAAEMLGQIGPKARSALDPLTQLLTDSSWNARPYGPLAIWRIDHDTNVLQYIVPNLESSGTASNYRRFLAIAEEMGPAAKPAVPAILRGMTNFATELSSPVREALQKIDPEAARKLGSEIP